MSAECLRRRCSGGNESATCTDRRMPWMPPTAAAYPKRFDAGPRFQPDLAKRPAPARCCCGTRQTRSRSGPVGTSSAEQLSSPTVGAVPPAAIPIHWCRCASRRTRRPLGTPPQRAPIPVCLLGWRVRVTASDATGEASFKAGLRTCRPPPGSEKFGHGDPRKMTRPIRGNLAIDFEVNGTAGNHPLRQTGPRRHRERVELGPMSERSPAWCRALARASACRRLRIRRRTLIDHATQDLRSRLTPATPQPAPRAGAPRLRVQPGR